jgi:hypothetical protein
MKAATWLAAISLAYGGSFGIAKSAAAQAPVVTHILVDARTPLHPINPAIYGVAFATAAVLRDLNLPLNRSGGNSATLYNWRIDARNAGSDFFFESLPATSAIGDQFQDGFVAASRDGGAAPMITIPMIGWAAKLGPGGGKLSAFSVARYGAQQAADTQYFPDAGNGVRPDGSLIAGNDPHDAAVPAALSEATERVAGLVAKWGARAAGGVPYYIIDNEPSLWHVTHRAVHPNGAHAIEVADGVIATSAAIRRSDPSALIVAPEEWGWPAYFASGFDQQSASLKQPAAGYDRATQTGGLDYLPFLLRTWRAAGHPVDVVSVHFYPQGGEYPDDGAGSRDLQLLRNRSTRSLWDPNYRDTSWIGSVVQLIPRLREWVNTYYWPGTPIALTEYSWGGDTSMSGATAQADIWGIFGREGLDLAARWQAPQPGTPVYRAMRLIRNYDGHGGAFGDMALKAGVPNPDYVSAFAARRSGDGALTVLVVNKELDTPTPLDVTLTLRTPSTMSDLHVNAYYLIAGVQSGPTTLPVSSAGRFVDTLPAQSIAIYEVPAR